MTDGWGIKYSFTADLSVGYQIPFGYLQINEQNNNLIVNPFLYVELGNRNYVEFVTPFFVPKLVLNFIGAKVNVVDF